MTQSNLWAPWRMSYIENLDPSASPSDKPGECFLCRAAAIASTSPSDPAWRQAVLLYRDHRGMILLNRYPYNSGHLLIAPLSHTSDLLDLSPSQRADLMELSILAQKIVRTAYNPQGINMGINIGRCAGAGLPGHIHMHVVPRWNGDSNFMSVLGYTRVMPQGLYDSYDRMAAVCATLTTE